jgi:glyoxylase-like metal-dependent hydrolase (beta-lactamase superfamily II)
MTQADAIRGELVARGIVVVETSTADGKIGAVIGRDASLAVDAGIDATEGRRLADAIRDLGPTPDRLAYTHAHVDHVYGGEPWIGGEVYAHREVADHITRQLPAWAERYGRAEDDIVASLAWPTVQFDDTLTLDVGGREIRLIPTPGHAPGAACVLVPDSGVLFGGDTVVTGIPPSFKDGDSGRLETTLRELANLDVEVLVPGHGPILKGRSDIREAMLWSADYLGRCREHVASRLGRESVEDIVAAAPFETFIGDRLPADRNRMPWRHEQTILMIATHMGGGD